MQKDRQAVFAACATLIISGLYERRALAEDLPANVPAQIRTAWAQARKTWKIDAQFVSLDLERGSAKEAFQADYAFRSNSDGRLYHIKSGPKGSSAALDQRAHFAWGLTSKVIDPVRAASVARAHGMKGNVLSAVLQYWTDPQTAGHPTTGTAQEIPIGMGVEVWRLAPDNDPNLADPNDPNMKNYYIDAMTGGYYDAGRLNPAEFIRNSMAYQSAAGAELMEGIRSAGH
jgi:hypothetical protein